MIVPRYAACCATALLAVACRGSPLPEAAVRCCVSEPLPALGELLPHVSADVAARLRAPRVLAAELDGHPPAEAVLAADVAGDDGRLTSSRIWIFARSGTHLALAATRDWPINSGAEAEDSPGLTAVATEHLLSPSVDVLRVERVDADSGHDPRYLVHSFEILRLTARGLDTVFSCPRVSSVTKGPARATYVTNRELHFRGGFPRAIVVTARVAFDPGVGDEPAERELFDPAFAQHEAAGAREVMYTVATARYEPSGPDLCTESP